MDKSTVIITGATGLVGVHTTELLAKSYNVIALGRNKQKLAKLAKIENVEALEFDITQAEDFSKLKQADYIVHCAAAVSGADPKTLHNVNIKGTEYLVKRAEELNVKGFVHISSVTVYGIQNKVLYETDEIRPASIYAHTKVAAEKIIKESSLNWNMLRPPYISGPYDENFLFEFGRRIEKGSMPMISRNGSFGVLDARDLARAIEMLLESNLNHQIYNIEGGQIGRNEFINMMGELLPTDPPYGKMYPYRFLYTVGTILDAFAKIRGKSNDKGISRYRIRSLSMHRIMNLDRIIHDLGFEPTISIQQSVVDWITSRK